MGRDGPSVVAAGLSLAAVQLAAVGLATFFQPLAVFPDPQNPTNPLVYVLIILLFTGVVLAMVRLRKEGWIKVLILASVFLTLLFVLYVPFVLLFLLFLDFVTADLLATALSLASAGLLTWLLHRRPEWYVVDGVGIAVAVGVTAILGVSFGILPAVILLVALAVYDAVSVYKTKHMVTLADAVAGQRLPVMLVIPKRFPFSFLKEPGLKEQLAKGEEREAMYVGLGDLIIPGVLAVSAFTFLSLKPVILGGAGHLAVALGTIGGCLVGFAALMRYVAKGNPQAGLPLLNGGALAGYAASYALTFGLALGDFSFGLWG